MTTTSYQHAKRDAKGPRLGEAAMLRAIMKNNKAIRSKVVKVLREETGRLGIEFDEGIWDEIVLANASELESSMAHVIE